MFFLPKFPFIPFVEPIESLTGAELQRVKRTSEALWLKGNGNTLCLEDLVMTSSYERASVHPFIEALGEEEGRL